MFGKYLKKTNLLGCFLFMPLAVSTNAFGQIDRAYTGVKCQLNGEYSAVIKFDKSSMAVREPMFDIKRGLIDLCGLKSTELKNVTNINAEVWTPYTGSEVTIYQNRVATRKEVLKASPDLQEVSLPVVVDTSYGIRLGLTGHFFLDKVVVYSTTKLGRFTQLCEKINDNHYKITHDNDPINTPPYGYEFYYGDQLEDICPMLNEEKLSRLAAINMKLSSDGDMQNSMGDLAPFSFSVISGPNRLQRIEIPEGAAPEFYEVRVPERKWSDRLIFDFFGKGKIYEVNLFMKRKKTEDPVSKKIINCESKDFDKTVCKVEGLLDAKLYEQLSQQKCEKNKNFFVRINKLVVKDGCRGNFEVTYK